MNEFMKQSARWGNAMKAATIAAIDSLHISPEYQMRVKLDAGIVKEYVELIEQLDGTWPFRDPLSVTRFNDQLILTDGFHRVEAMRQAGEQYVMIYIKDGTDHDAKKSAMYANRDHGLRLTNADKRRKVTIALADTELSQWSDRKLAELCGVSDHFVASVRAQLRTVRSCAPATTTGDDGKQRPANKEAATAQREQIVSAVTANDGESDRQIAKRVGCSGGTVASVRRELEQKDTEPVEPEDDDEVSENVNSFDKSAAVARLRQRLGDAMREELQEWPDGTLDEGVSQVRLLVTEIDNDYGSKLLPVAIEGVQVEIRRLMAQFPATDREVMLIHIIDVLKGEDLCKWKLK